MSGGYGAAVGFDVAEIFKIGAGAEDMGAVDELMTVEVVVAT